MSNESAIYIKPPEPAQENIENSNELNRSQVDEKPKTKVVRDFEVLAFLAKNMGDVNMSKLSYPASDE
jgi:hypothetical protein